MARRTSTAKSDTIATESTTPTTEESTVTATVEAPVDTDTTPEAAVEAAVETVTEAAAEKEIDLGPFEKAVELAIESRDADTGDLSADDAQPATDAYRALEGIKAKNAAKKFLDAAMKAALLAGDITLTRSYYSLSEFVTAAPVKASTATPKVPTDPTEAFVERVVAQSLAADIVQSNVPEGVSEDWSDKAASLADSLSGDVKSYATYLDTHAAWAAVDEAERGEEPATPEVSQVVVAAFKLASGRGAGLRPASRRTTASASPGYTGPRRDIGAHIQSAFADLESGSFLTIAEIRKHKSDQYGENEASAGAISARLFPASGKAANVEGISPTQTGGDKGDKRGAVKE